MGEWRAKWRVSEFSECGDWPECENEFECVPDQALRLRIAEPINRGAAIMLYTLN